MDITLEGPLNYAFDGMPLIEQSKRRPTVATRSACVSREGNLGENIYGDVSVTAAPKKLFYEQILELELRRLNQKRSELLDSKRFAIFPWIFKNYLKSIEIGIDDIERRIWEFGSKDRLDEKAVQARIEENDLQIDALLRELGVGPEDAAPPMEA